MSPRRTLRAIAGKVPLLAEATLAVVGFRLALWMLPSRTILRHVRRLAHPETPRPERNVDVLAVASTIETVARRVPGASCLTQALATKLLLRRRGVSSSLRVGVASNRNGGFIAHAWVECRGRVIIGGGMLPQLTALPDLWATQPAKRR